MYCKEPMSDELLIINCFFLTTFFFFLETLLPSSYLADRALILFN